MPASARISPRSASSPTSPAGSRISPAATSRNVSRSQPSMARPAAILTDIEGTTTSIAFVKDRLFPFAGEALAGLLAAHGGTLAVAAILEQVRALAPGQDQAAVLPYWMA